MFIWKKKSQLCGGIWARKNTGQKMDFRSKNFKDIPSKNWIYIALSLIVFEISNSLNSPLFHVVKITSQIHVYLEKEISVMCRNLGNKNMGQKNRFPPQKVQKIITSKNGLHLVLGALNQKFLHYENLINITGKYQKNHGNTLAFWKKYWVFPQCSLYGFSL